MFLSQVTIGPNITNSLLGHSELSLYLPPNPPLPDSACMSHRGEEVAEAEIRHIVQIHLWYSSSHSHDLQQ